MKRIITLFYNYFKYLIILINDHICRLWIVSCRRLFSRLFFRIFCKETTD